MSVFVGKYFFIGHKITGVYLHMEIKFFINQSLFTSIINNINNINNGDTLLSMRINNHSIPEIFYLKETLKLFSETRDFNINKNFL